MVGNFILSLVKGSLREKRTFKISGAAIAIFMTSLISVWGTVLGRGPFVVDTLSYSLLLLQLFIGTVASAIMVLAAAVAERAKTNREITQQKNQYEAILKSIGDGVFAVDTQDNIILMNHAAETMLQVKATEALGHP